MASKVRWHRVRGWGSWDYGVSVSVAECRTTEGVRIEGTGIIPDEYVLITRDELVWGGRSSRGSCARVARLGLGYSEGRQRVRHQRGSGRLTRLRPWLSRWTGQVAYAASCLYVVLL